MQPLPCLLCPPPLPSPPVPSTVPMSGRISSRTITEGGIISLGAAYAGVLIDSRRRCRALPAACLGAVLGGFKRAPLVFEMDLFSTYTVHSHGAATEPCKVYSSHAMPGKGGRGRGTTEVRDSLKGNSCRI